MKATNEKKKKNPLHPTSPPLRSLAGLRRDEGPQGGGHEGAEGELWGPGDPSERREARRSGETGGALTGEGGRKGGGWVGLFFFLLLCWVGVFCFVWFGFGCFSYKKKRGDDFFRY